MGKLIKYATYLLLIQLVTCLYCFLEVKAQQNRFINYGVEQGLPQAYVYSISQNPDDYLWIATGNGLSRFDGHNFVNYNTSDSLGGNFITCCLATLNGYWYGHMNGNLTYKDRQGFRKVIPNLESKSSVTDIKEDSEGNIWFSNQSNGLVRIDKDYNILPVRFKGGNLVVFNFEFISEDEILIGSVNGLKHCKIIDDGKVQILSNVDNVKQSRIKSIVKAKNENGYYILSADENIQFLSVEENGFLVKEISKRLNNNLGSIQHLFEDSNSNIWVSTFGKGLHKIKKNGTSYQVINTYNESNGLPSENVKLVFEDNESNIWVSVYGKGIARLIDPSYKFYTPESEKYGSTVSAICVDDKYVWLGMEKGLLRRNKSGNKEIKFYDTYRGLPFDKITALYNRKPNDLWVGTEKHGVYRLDILKDKFVRYDIEGGILENSINSITGKDNDIWIATKKGAYHLNLLTNKYKWYTISKGGLPHNCVNHILIDSKKRVWVSTLSSFIVYIANEKVTKVDLLNEKRYLDIRSISEDFNGNIWIGTRGNGVFTINIDSITNLSSNHGLISDYCYSLIPDSLNRMWITHRGGLSRIEDKNLQVKPLTTNVGIDKTIEFQFNSCYADSENKLWFGMNQGVFLYDPSSETAVSKAPVLKLTSVQINNEEVNFDEKIILSPGRYKITIKYIGIHLKEPGLVKYRHVFEGYDENWTEFSLEKEITYHGVTDGNFNFIVEASNGDGIITKQPVNLKIYIKTPFWKQVWFYLLVTVLSIAFIVLYIKIRERKLKRENKILEEKVNKRTIEIVKQKEEIEKQRDLIKSKNKDITDSIRYASKIQAAVVPPVKYLEEVFKESFILNKPKDIVSGDFYWLTKFKNKIIVAVADCTGHGVPGAFMSMLGVTLLNEIVNHKNITNSDEILNQLRKNIIISLRQSNEEATTNDGMDIALIVIDHNKKELTFSGAFNPVLVVRENAIITLKADRMPIGIYYRENTEFSSHKMSMLPGDMIYLYTDGYPDQFGGIQDRKFTTKKFKNILLDIHKKPMSVQRTILENTIENWMNGTEQVDDITVMGIRV